jgi:diaphanous 1
VSELLAAICVLSMSEGHKAVLAAMSDYRVAYDESFRFESLIGCLRFPNLRDGDFQDQMESENEEEGIWEARTASMALVNALTNCPESLEDRILLRDEFARRGLNEAIVVYFRQSLSVGQLLIRFSGSAIRQASRCTLDAA